MCNLQYAGSHSHLPGLAEMESDRKLDARHAVEEAMTGTLKKSRSKIL